jgi:sugar phosphate isomerase/epimerase
MLPLSVLPLSVNEVTTYRWTFDEDVWNYQAAGIPAIGVWRQKLSDFGEEKGIELLAESELGVSNLLWAGGFTGSEGRTFRESVADAREAIQLASDLRASCVVIYSGARGGHTCNHSYRLLRDAMRQLAPLAEEFGVDLAIEPMHPGCAEECTFVTSLELVERLFEDVPSRRLKLVFDTYHLGHDPENLSQLASLAERIAVVHLGDGRSAPEREQDRCRLGEGSIPLQQIVDTLQQAGYEGYYDLELIGEEIEQCDYIELLEQSKQYCSQLLLRHSVIDG